MGPTFPLGPPPPPAPLVTASRPRNTHFRPRRLVPGRGTPVVGATLTERTGSAGRPCRPWAQASWSLAPSWWERAFRGRAPELDGGDRLHRGRDRHLRRGAGQGLVVPRLSKTGPVQPAGPAGRRAAGPCARLVSACHRPPAAPPRPSCAVKFLTTRAPPAPKANRSRAGDSLSKGKGGFRYFSGVRPFCLAPGRACVAAGLGGRYSGGAGAGPPGARP
jgi:hypothetical protein